MTILLLAMTMLGVVRSADAAVIFSRPAPMSPQIYHGRRSQYEPPPSVSKRLCTPGGFECIKIEPSKTGKKEQK